MTNKKISKLTRKQRINICTKYYNKDAFDTCKDCPLRIDTIHCCNGVIEDLKEAKNKVADLTELLRSIKDQEIEVKANE